MTEIEELFEALAECKVMGIDRLWFTQNANGTYAIGYGDDVVATSTSRTFAVFVRLAMNNLPALLEAVEALEAVKARASGEFDHPALLKYGELGTTSDDVVRIAKGALEKLK